jgi:hypothetical protein
MTAVVVPTPILLPFWYIMELPISPLESVNLAM